MLPNKGLQSRARMADPKKSPSGALAFHKNFKEFKETGVVPARFRRGNDNIIPNAEAEAFRRPLEHAEDFPHLPPQQAKEFARRSSEHSEASRRPSQCADSTSGSWPTWILIMKVIGVLGLASGVSYCIWHHCRSTKSTPERPHPFTGIFSDGESGSDSIFPNAAAVLRSRKRKLNLTARNLAIAGLGAAVVGGIVLGCTGTPGSSAGPDKTGSDKEAQLKLSLPAKVGLGAAALTVVGACVSGYCSALYSKICGPGETTHVGPSPPHVPETNVDRSRDPIGLEDNDKPLGSRAPESNHPDERGATVPATQTSVAKREIVPPAPKMVQLDKPRETLGSRASPESILPAGSVKPDGSAPATPTSDAKQEIVPPIPSDSGFGANANVNEFCPKLTAELSEQLQDFCHEGKADNPSHDCCPRAEVLKQFNLSDLKSEDLAAVLDICRQTKEMCNCSILEYLLPKECDMRLKEVRVALSRHSITGTLCFNVSDPSSGLLCLLNSEVDLMFIFQLLRTMQKMQPNWKDNEGYLKKVVLPVLSVQHDKVRDLYLTFATKHYEYIWTATTRKSRVQVYTNMLRSEWSLPADFLDEDITIALTLEKIKAQALLHSGILPMLVKEQNKPGSKLVDVVSVVDKLSNEGLPNYYRDIAFPTLGAKALPKCADNSTSTFKESGRLLLFACRYANKHGRSEHEAFERIQPLVDKTTWEDLRLSRQLRQILSTTLENPGLLNFCSWTVDSKNDFMKLFCEDWTREAGTNLLAALARGKSYRDTKVDLLAMEAEFLMSEKELNVSNSWRDTLSGLLPVSGLLALRAQRNLVTFLRVFKVLSAEQDVRKQVLDELISLNDKIDPPIIILLDTPSCNTLMGTFKTELKRRNPNLKLSSEQQKRLCSAFGMSTHKASFKLMFADLLSN